MTGFLIFIVVVALVFCIAGFLGFLGGSSDKADWDMAAADLWVSGYSEFEIRDILGKRPK